MRKFLKFIKEALANTLYFLCIPLIALCALVLGWHEKAPLWLDNAMDRLNSVTRNLNPYVKL